MTINVDNELEQIQKDQEEVIKLKKQILESKLKVEFVENSSNELFIKFLNDKNISWAAYDVQNGFIKTNKHYTATIYNTYSNKLLDIAKFFYEKQTTHAKTISDISDLGDWSLEIKFTDDTQLKHFIDFLNEKKISAMSEIQTDFCNPSKLYVVTIDNKYPKILLDVANFLDEWVSLEFSI